MILTGKLIRFVISINDKKEEKEYATLVVPKVSKDNQTASADFYRVNITTIQAKLNNLNLDLLKAGDEITINGNVTAKKWVSGEKTGTNFFLTPKSFGNIVRAEFANEQPVTLEYDI